MEVGDNEEIREGMESILPLNKTVSTASGIDCEANSGPSLWNSSGVGCVTEGLWELCGACGTAI